MEKVVIVEHHGKGRHSAAACKKVVIAQQRGKSSHAVSPFSAHVCCGAMSNFSTLLHYIYFFHAAGLCLLFPHCCNMSTFFPCCCAMSTISTKLHPVYFSTLLCHVYFYNACSMSPFYVAVLCLLFPHCYDSAHGIGVQNVTSNCNVATLNCFFFLLIVS